jgi:hypothetical protein
MIKVLFLASNPYEDDAHLRLDREMSAIDAAIQRGRGRDAFDLRPHFAVKIRELQKFLLRHEPDVVHFSGHGDGHGGILVEGEDGNAHEVPREALNELFGILEHPPRIVVLNACDSLPNAEAAGDAVDYTIGMNSPVEDSAAAVFAEFFYAALAEGQTVDRAFRLGVQQLRMEQNPQAGIPTLHVRPGTDTAVALVTTDVPAAAGPPLVIENRMGEGDPEPGMSQTYTWRDESGQLVTFRNG